MRKLVVSEFITLDGVIQAPEARTRIATAGSSTAAGPSPTGTTTSARTSARDAGPMPCCSGGAPTSSTRRRSSRCRPGDPFGDMMNAPAKYVVSKTLEKPIWRNTTIIRDDVVGAVRRSRHSPGKNILTDGSSQLVHLLLQHDLVDELHLLLYPLALGGGKRLFPEGVHTRSRSRKRRRIRAASSASTTSGRNGQPDRLLPPEGGALGREELLCVEILQASPDPLDASRDRHTRGDGVCTRLADQESTPVRALELEHRPVARARVESVERRRGLRQRLLHVCRREIVDLDVIRRYDVERPTRGHRRRACQGSARIGHQRGPGVRVLVAGR